MRNLVIGIAVLLIACSGGDRTRPPVRLVRSPAAGGERLTLHAAPGIRINARLKPSLELPGGPVLRFDSPWITPDSSYFTQPPAVLVRGRSTGGRVRVSVCGSDAVCRGIVIELGAMSYEL